MTISFILDTCAMLDLVRAPARVELDAPFATAALEIYEAATSASPAVKLIVIDLVQREYLTNVNQVIAESTAALRKARGPYLHSLTVAANYLRTPLEPCVSDAWIDQAIGLGKDLVDRMIVAATIEPVTDDDKGHAFNRSYVKRPPARRGNSSLDDCIIVETALRLQRALPAGERAVLLSSNTRDYCGGGTGLLRPELQADFDSCGLTFAVNWAHARSMI